MTRGPAPLRVTIIRARTLKAAGWRDAGMDACASLPPDDPMALSIPRDNRIEHCLAFSRGSVRKSLGFYTKLCCF